MSFKVPKDIENSLKKKYPHVNIPEIVNDIFSMIVEKTFKHSSCSIRELGKFVAFQTYSGKLQKYTGRFKFQTANSLNSKIKKDNYLIENLPLKARNIYNEENEKVCQNFQDQKKANTETVRKSSKIEKDGTQKSLVKDEINELLNED
ncbi:MAG: hypothetical protein K9H48_07855 [Melioribacteraceae bacterium]|nr:hypothetical protein [Melioribacteraceae bacterium]